MGFSVDSFLDDIANNTSLSSAVGNPIYVGLMIVLIMLLIIFVMFKSDYDDSESSFWKTLFRTGFYMAPLVMAALFIHYRNVERAFEQKYEDKTTTGTVTAAVSKSEVSGAFEPSTTFSILPDL
mgnify:CR=1 FL=1